MWTVVLWPPLDVTGATVWDTITMEDPDRGLPAAASTKTFSSWEHTHQRHFSPHVPLLVNNAGSPGWRDVNGEALVAEVFEAILDKCASRLLPGLSSG